MSWLERRDDLFMAASELPNAERRAYLEAECGDDADLLHDVLSLLEADADAEEFMEGALADAARTILKSGDEAVQGRRIGPYVVEGVLGTGGMGTVYLARRSDASFEKQVAIKVIRWSADSDETRRRFAVERQILANLEHPYIARLLDGGTTEDGVPYVVMEHVDGEPIDAWCDRQRLGIQARLKMFVKICEAVQYAHANLTVHRDIKPDNVLITADGSPRLIDFGIAKLIEDPGTGGATRTGMHLMTPDYASPEQLRGDPVTVATDIYSLGVLLYELLTGRWPYPGSTEGARAREHAVLEGVAAPPALAAVRDDARTAELATARGLDPDRLARRLRGDLDTVVLTCLRKEPRRRYISVQQLEDDVQRYLERRPVMARRDTFRYRATRFAQRNWVGVGAAALVLASLVGGMALAWSGLERATVAQQVAEVNAARADTINAFLTSMLASVRPDRAQGNVVTVREVLDTAAARLERDDALSGETEVASALLFTIGESYLALGELDAAASVFRRALSIQEQLYEDVDDRVLESHIRLGEIAWQQGDLEASLGSAERILDIRRATLGTLHPEYSAALLNVGNTLADMGRLDDAEPLVREAIAVDRQVLEGDQVELLGFTLNSLGTILVDLGRFDEAVGLHEESLSLRRQFSGDTSTAVVTAMTNLSLALDGSGRLDEAEATARGALSRADLILGSDHPRRGHAQVNLARILTHAGRTTEAEPFLREAIGIYSTQLGAGSWRVGIARGYLGEVLLGLGRSTEAVEELDAAWTTLEEALPKGHPRVRMLAAEVAEALERSGDPKRAEEWRLRAS